MTIDGIRVYHVSTCNVGTTLFLKHVVVTVDGSDDCVWTNLGVKYTIYSAGHVVHPSYVCMCVCTYVCMYACMYLRMYVCIYVRMYLCMYVCMYVYMYVCIYVCMYVCMY